LLIGDRIVVGRPVVPTVGRRPAALAALALVGFLTACGGRPTSSDPVSWRPVLTRALSELRRADPERAERLERLIQDAEVAQAAVKGRRSADRATREWCEAMTSAADEVRQVRQAGAESAIRARERVEAAAHMVELAEARSMAAGSSREHARAALTARLRFRTAESLMQSGEFDEAFIAAEDAIALADVAQDGWRRQHDRIADPELRARWSRQVAETLDLSRRQGVSVVIVDKAGHRLLVYRRGRQVAVFKAELGTAGLAPKRHAGDCATPEGRYRVTTVKTGGATRYYKALLLDYPNPDDRRRHRLERDAGTIEAGVGPGSLIEIHGHGGQGRDWTEGCVALRDRDMDRLLELVAAGTPVTIVGGMD
jgi:hypothetical protein